MGNLGYEMVLSYIKHYILAFLININYYQNSQGLLAVDILVKGRPLRGVKKSNYHNSSNIRDIELEYIGVRLERGYGHPMPVIRFDL